MKTKKDTPMMRMMSQPPVAKCNPFATTKKSRAQHEVWKDSINKSVAENVAKGLDIYGNLPTCPVCKKNDKVFASAMRGRKDFACTRCKRTFVKVSARRRG